MSCSSCARSVPDGARFCPHCGAEQVAECAACGQSLPPDARFCAACGTPVAAGQAAPAPAAPAGPVAERRVTSVLFGDLVGFTTLSETRDAEDVRELLSGYFQRCRVIVARYGGTIEKFIGDAVMAVWGVPVAHEDDAERAVRAGLELVEAVAGFGEQAGAPDLALRVGVVTGEVAVTLGAQAEGMVAGDAVNTAARVQSQARPRSVWVDEQTRALAAASVDFTSTGAHPLKGKAEPVQLYEVVAVMDAVGGSQRPERIEAPLVARRREFGIVKETFHAVAEDGRGRLLVVAGEPGVGKTRLGWELQKYLDGLSDRVRWHWGRALAYGDGVAYSPLTAAVRGRAGIDTGDDPRAVAARIEESLQKYGADATARSWLAPRLAVLFGGAAERAYSRGDLFAAWLAWFELLGADGTPVVWVIDDAHHADDAVLDFADHLVSAARTPLLLVVLTRPELLSRRPELATSRRSTVVHLEGLTPIAMTSLVGRLVDLPDEVSRRIVEQAEGVPLYAVEIIRSLRDQGLLSDRVEGGYTLANNDPGAVAAITTPTSLRVLVSSRLDTLAPDERSLLGAAAVLGTAFTADSLAAVVGQPVPRVTDRLQPLVRRELLRVVTDALTGELGQYAFVQTLVRQVAYQTQSRRDRLERHLVAAEHLEGVVGSAGQLTVVIAGHLTEATRLLAGADPRLAQVRERAARWHERAGDRARSLGAPMEAVAAYESALALLDDPGSRARVLLAAADSAIVAGRYALAVRHAQAVDRDQPLDVLARVDAARGQALRRDGADADAVALLTPWLQRLDEIPATAGSDIARELAFSLHQSGDLDGAVPIGERAMLLAEDSGRPDLIARALNVLGVHADLRGLWRSARALYAEAAAFARPHELTTELGFVLQNLSAIELTRDLAAGVGTAREALDLAQRTGHTSQANYAATNLIEGLRGLGRWDEAIAVSGERVIGDSIEAGLLDVHQIALDLGLIALARGERPREIAFRTAADPMSAALLAAAEDRVGDAFDLARPHLLAEHARTGLDEEFTTTWVTTLEWGIGAGRASEVAPLLALVADAPAGLITPMLAAQLRRLGAMLAIAADVANADDDGRIERDLRGAMAGLDALGAEPYLARTQATLGHWLAGHGRSDEAEPLLASARATFERLRAVRWSDELARRSDVALDRVT